MSIFSWIQLLLFILASEIHSQDDWLKRSITWTKKKKEYKLLMCASKPGEQMCNTFTWNHQTKKGDWSKCERTGNVTEATRNCYGDKQQFDQIWKSYTCYCCPPNNSKMTSHTTATPGSIATLITYSDDKNSTRSIKMLAGLAATLAVLLVIVTSGWVWTCWIVKKLRKTSTKGSKYVNIIEVYVYAITHPICFSYENFPLGSPQNARCQSSSDYSLLWPTANGKVTDEYTLYSGQLSYRVLSRKYEV